jgi:tetratricopeptide (TPR) repeat protein
MAMTFYEMQDFPGAVSVFDRRIALDPNTAEAYYYRGLSQKELKNLPESVASLRQAWSLAPDKFDYPFWTGMVLAEMDSVAAAKQVLGRAVELDSAGTNKNTGFALRQLGYYALLAKENGDATRMLERSVAINPTDLQAWIWLGQGHHNAGNKSRACEAYDRALALKPDEATAAKGKKTLGCAPQ